MITADLLLAYGGVYTNIKSGEDVFSEGEHCNYYYHLVKGKIYWKSALTNGKEFLHSIVCDGQPFGELPMFDGESYTATAVAKKPSVLIRLHKNDLQRLVAEKPAIKSILFLLLATRLRFRYHLMRELFTTQPALRINALISYFKVHGEHHCPRSGKLHLTRQEIANMTGLRVETVIRTMRDMHASGEIKIKHGKAYVI